MRGNPCAYTPYCSARESRNASCTHSHHSYHECPSPCATWGQKAGPKSSRETTVLHRHSILYIEGVPASLRVPASKVRWQGSTWGWPGASSLCQSHQRW